jgi:hypothetical protein
MPVEEAQRQQDEFAEIRIARFAEGVFVDRVTSANSGSGSILGEKRAAGRRQ